MSKPPAEQAKQLLDNASLQEFLTFLKQEREFADATIVNRERSLKPFLGWLVAKDVPLFEHRGFSCKSENSTQYPPAFPLAVGLDQTCS